MRNLTKRRHLGLWLPSYLGETMHRYLMRIKRRSQLTHLIFLVCDHFEPRHEMMNAHQPGRRLSAWREGYKLLQMRCGESFGTRPVHTWFYPPHHGYEHLRPLAELAFSGLGEVELHYHHQNDTRDSLRNDLQKCLAEYNRWGLLLESGLVPKTSFGFIHGDWALNNSCGGRYCGVNDELSLLAELGCWADFTMPSSNSCQTRQINSIYYGTSKSEQPKAHDTGLSAEVGVTGRPGTLIIQGPLCMNWGAPRYPRIENGSLTSANWGRPDRIKSWIGAHVHVKNRPDWLFVKLHTHGAVERDFDALFGEKAFEMHRYLNEHYNDGKRFRLHYVTARQAFNLAKAAEHGKCGSPEEWLNFAIGPPVTHFYFLNARHLVKACTNDLIYIDAIECSEEVCFRSAIAPAVEIRGKFSFVHLDKKELTIRLMLHGECLVSHDRTLKLQGLDGGAAIGEAGKISIERSDGATPSICELRFTTDS